MFGLPIRNKNSVINASLTFLFDVFELKEKYHIRKKKNNNNKKSVYMRNQYYFYSDLTKIMVSRARTTKT